MTGSQQHTQGSGGGSSGGGAGSGNGASQAQVPLCADSHPGFCVTCYQSVRRWACVPSLVLGRAWRRQSPGEGFPGPALPSEKVPLPQKQPQTMGRLGGLPPWAAGPCPWSQESLLSLGSGDEIGW